MARPWQLNLQSNRVTGFDLNNFRVNELLRFNDFAKQLDVQLLESLLVKESTNKKKGLFLSFSEMDLIDLDIYIAMILTPVDNYKKLDLSHLLSTCKLISKTPRKGNIVIFESTVYLGYTEEDYLPILEQYSKLKYSAIILAVAHNEFRTIHYKQYKTNNTVIFDVKAFVDRKLVDCRL